MKIRSGFVSNSSSSSFIVATKGVELTEDLVRDALGIKAGTPAEEIFDGVIEKIAKAKRYKMKDILDDWGVDDIEEIDDKDLQRILKEGWTVHSFYASNEDVDPAENFLCYTDVDVKTDTLYIKGGGGY